MRDRMEKFALLPFSMGCISESSVAIGQLHHKRSSTHETNLTPTRSQEEGKEDEEEEPEEGEDDDRISSLKIPNLSLMALPKFQRLFKNFKNLSHLFVDKDEMEEEMMVMEIGVPTNVKHVTHIGIDGASTSILSRSWEHLKTTNFLALSS